MEAQVLVTAGVAIRVTTQYRSDLSQLGEMSYFFNYRIEIENRNRFSVQLIHRDWFIFDSLNPPSHVSGEGVIGEQPRLDAGEIYSYTSGCELHSEVGGMNGFYTFKNVETNEFFRVNIPAFQLVYPARLN